MKVETIHVQSVSWHDKINGNTYHASKVFVNGRHVVSVSAEYGHDYVDTAFRELDESGITRRKVYSNGMHESYWYYCSDNDITLTYESLPALKRVVWKYGNAESVLV